ncbi:MAG: glutamine-hydrolyzing carbamoyl-phosphate synthase small subunit [Planctomycetaceae bacterium]|nr:glutamine-hydrolyzing carbamoyl-phosphate synthase small subunit [Planctomycetaceae bacterium]
MSRTAKLALSDGSVFTGEAFGAEGESFGEVVFNTSMTGYQEIITDPSYCGQIIVMTYPQIGNYGINPEDVESGRPALKGFVCREICHIPSNYRATHSLAEYLKQNGIIGISGIDTRALVRRLRTQGVMTGVLSTLDLDEASLVQKARSSPELEGQDFVRQVMPTGTRRWTECLAELAQTPVNVPRRKLSGRDRPLIVAIDYGMKWNIPRHLAATGCDVQIVPGTATAAEILALNPAGVFLSNGPGDPRPLDYAIQTIRELLGRKPIFGICLGLQLLGLAFGGQIYKLKFGHRGANQPVKHLLTGKVEVTSQNHGFALAAESLPAEVEVTHLNLNDNTVAGIRHKSLPAFGVQYHPEASAGPHDSRYLFDDFIEMVQGESAKSSV